MYVKIVGDTAKYHAKLERMGEHLIKVSGLVQNTNGFRMYLDNDTLIGDYSKYIYPYLDPTLGEGIYMYSDNNMNYEDEGKPTKEEQINNKIKDIVIKETEGDLTTLSQQITETNNMLQDVYDVLLALQMSIVPSDSDDGNIEENTETNVADDTDDESPTTR